MYIKCPYCGVEYHWEEIFIPQFLSSGVKHISKDTNGHITSILSLHDDVYDEDFVCPSCNNLFHVHMDMVFDVTKISEEAHITKLW